MAGDHHDLLGPVLWTVDRAQVDGRLRSISAGIADASTLLVLALGQGRRTTAGREGEEPSSPCGIADLGVLCNSTN